MIRVRKKTYGNISVKKPDKVSESGMCKAEFILAKLAEQAAKKQSKSRTPESPGTKIQSLLPELPNYNDEISIMTRTANVGPASTGTGVANLDESCETGNPKPSCNCPKSDSWRCARARGLTGVISCDCDCHNYIKKENKNNSE